MRPLLRAGLLALALLGAGAARAQEAQGPPVAAAHLGPDYEAWGEVAARAEALSLAGRGSDFAIARLRADLVDWREAFAQAETQNAARLSTVAAQVEALGPPPADGEPAEDAQVAARRADLADAQARLRAPGALAAEAYAHADGLIGEMDALSRSRQAARLLDRVASPLDPRVWPEAAEAVSARLTGLWKEVSTSVRSPARHEAFARQWPAALALLALALLTLLRGRRAVEALLDAAGIEAFRGRHGMRVREVLLSLAACGLPVLGLWWLARAVMATGLLGARAGALVQAAPLAAACVAACAWLSRRFLDPARPAPPPFDLAPEARARAARWLGRAGWALAARVMVRAFLLTGDLDNAARATLTLPIDAWLAWALGGLGLTLARAAMQGGEEDEGLRLRRQGLRLAGWALALAAGAAPLFALLGFHRAGIALLVPTVLTTGLAGAVVALQWLAADLYGMLTRREDGIRDALSPVLVGFALTLAALPVLALVWGARPEDLSEVWTRVRSGFQVGETRLSPGVVALFALAFGAGFLLTRGVQGALRSTVLPKTRLDPGARTAVVAGVGYVGLTLAALFAVSVAGLDLSNLAIVAGALSVGIGFGLQTVVSNFVSGIILLIERPISEGDWIEVGGRMGYVRDISVRSTRIETFDRTDVIVPNADLVSGQVVNWTRGNLVGRLVLPVSIAMGADPAHVAEALREVAEAHPMVLLTPPPAVVLAGFGADALNFEVRVIIRDVNYGSQARSELNHAIARRLAAEGVRTAGAAAPPAPLVPIRPA